MTWEGGEPHIPPVFSQKLVELLGPARKGDEDINENGVVDIGETDPCNADSDSDSIQDGTESGIVDPVADPDSDGPLLGTDLLVFQPDLDPLSTTDPIVEDTDDDDTPDDDDTTFIENNAPNEDTDGDDTIDDEFIK